MSAFEARLTEHYRDLSERLRAAADYIAGNKIAVATRSLRSLAGESKLPPATFSRLSQALQYDSFEQLREEMRHALEERINSFSDRARRLQTGQAAGGRELLDAHAIACLDNLQQMTAAIDRTQLTAAVAKLHAARSILVSGNLGSQGIAEYMVYQMNFVGGNWAMAGHGGASIAASLVDMDHRDVLLLITKAPYARRSVAAAELASRQGIHVIVICDAPESPALRFADTAFRVPTESPNFFSSYAATLVLVEVLVGMLVALAGPRGSERIAAVEEKNRRLQEVWDG
ncbi:MurR/RpiR family transcriptional regulator [Pseudohoeflea coraliihabitans]|uniref:MurR/RpiR family transcriptional regulator n=1 Tax=Pseudohoeflea coraliihabitans TaxID=2860393 RepID=A0ABS6WQW8_9HYPH|nr:MurR/RpiR family transcriptional regulator [Pseudohoeflea sp. DP4N28-3]MBW3097439.1 MurR/RpiR family transcriptional regulator [Pseudohoeflea sp. DP4N28-3]